MNNTQSPFGDAFKLLTENRLKNFWGYGSLDAPTWFIGMEEGLGDGIEHIEKRFRAADGKATVDMRNDMKEVEDHIRWFQQNAPIQSTWKYPIALYLYLKNGTAPSTDEIREYQALRLGDTTLKETVGLELMPLPSTKADQSTWIYDTLNIPGLATRAEYLNTYKSERTQKLRELLHTHRPSLVIMYSLTYLPDWTEVIGKKPLEVTKGMYLAEADGIAYCIIPQSASFGMSYARLYEFAEKVRPHIENTQQG
jgi:hypothetical protein